jgi:hypothetical protein
MACELLTGGLPKTCTNNLGGIAKAWLTDLESVLSITQGDLDLVTAISLASGAAFYEIQFNRDTSNYTEVNTPNQPNNSSFWLQTVVLVNAGRSKEKRAVINLLPGKDVVFIIKDNVGKFWLYGWDKGMTLSEASGGSGTAKTDLNGQTLTFTAEEVNSAPEIDSTIIDALISE